MLVEHVVMQINKIDLWVYNNQASLDIKNLDWKYIRKGWNEYIE